jgi:hypothetical protein
MALTATKGPGNLDGPGDRKSAGLRRGGMARTGAGQITFPTQRPCHHIKDVHADV